MFIVLLFECIQGEGLAFCSKLPGTDHGEINGKNMNKLIDL